MSGHLCNGPFDAFLVTKSTLNLQIFLEWARLMHLGRDEHAYREMRDWIVAFEQHPKRWTKYYGWQVTMRWYEDIYGNVLHYKRKTRVLTSNLYREEINKVKLQLFIKCTLTRSKRSSQQLTKETIAITDTLLYHKNVP